MAETYRGWRLEFQYGYWYGYSDNYEADWQGEEDGYVSNGEEVQERTLDDAKEAIDDFIIERGYELTVERQQATVSLGNDAPPKETPDGPEES